MLCRAFCYLVVCSAGHGQRSGVAAATAGSQKIRCMGSLRGHGCPQLSLDFSESPAPNLPTILNDAVFVGRCCTRQTNCARQGSQAALWGCVGFARQCLQHHLSRCTSSFFGEMKPEAVIQRLQLYGCHEGKQQAACTMHQCSWSLVP